MKNFMIQKYFVLFCLLCAVTGIYAQFSYNGIQITTQTALQNAIDNMADNVPGVIVVMNDIALTAAITVPQRKRPVIVSNSEVRLTVSSNIRHFSTMSGGNTTNERSLTLGGNLILTRANGYSGEGGGVQVGGGTDGANHTFTLQDNAKITNNSISVSASVVSVIRGTFNMDGGEISGNIFTTSGGGGIGLSSARFIMNDGVISGNRSGEGSGVYMNASDMSVPPEFIMNGGKISGNTAISVGGGVRIANGTFTMKGGEISGNTAGSHGGGVFVYSSANFKMEGGTINGNTAAQNGGGIYAANYNNLTISNTAIFTGNTAATSHNYPGVMGENIILTTAQTGITEITGITPGVSGNIQNILWATTSIPGTHLLNNYDIAYAGSPYTIPEKAPDWERLRQAINSHSAATITIHPKSAVGVTEDLANGVLWLNDNEDFIDSDGTQIVLARSVELKAGIASKPITLYTRNAGNSRHFNVTGISTLKMDGVILDGSNVAGGINVAGMGNLTLFGGVITNCHALNGGGVYVDSNGIFTMENGEISDNTASNDGGGVYVNGAAFTLKDGKISHNTANSISASRGGGGVYITSKGTFKMENGEISENTASIGGGVIVDGANTTFLMDNGKINNNTAIRSGGGVRVQSSGKFIMERGEVNYNTANGGGGVSVISSGANFIMNGGEICGNTTIATDISYGRGGGVFISNIGTFLMVDGKISGNISSDNGGGVYFHATCTFTMENGKISGNTANNGGGVHFYGTGAQFTIKDGDISDNKADNEGGGIYAGGFGANFSMFTGKISGNNATTNGGGIFAMDYTNLDLRASAVFTGNTAAVAHDCGIANRGANQTLTADQSGITGVTGNIQNILWATTSIQGTHLLNNYDVAYRGGAPINITAIEISLDKNEIYLLKGATADLTATATGSGVVEWSSNHSSVATVNNGAVKAISPGIAVITATVGSEEATCTVTVIQPGNSTIEGTVNNAGGSNVRINLYMKPPDSDMKRGIIGGYMLLASTVPNDDGTYSFKDLPEGSYQVEVVMDDYEPEASDELSLSGEENLTYVNFTVDVEAGKIVVDEVIIAITTGAVETGRAQSLQIYPNPFTDVVQITGTVVETWHAASLQIQIINIAGAIVHTQTITSSEEIIHLDHLPAGMYIIRIENGRTVKAIKSH